MFDFLGRAYHRWDTERRVRRHGWTAVYVGDYHSAPTWAYSVGFHASLGAPEVIVFDIPMADANALFYQIYNDLKSGGLVLGDHDPWRPGEFEHPLVWRRVHDSRMYDRDPENPWLGLAEDFGGALAPDKGRVTAFQLVAPDAHGHLPWTPGYDERLRPRQRELYLPVG